MERKKLGLSLALALAIVGCFCSGAFADAITLPDAGVAVADFVAAGITAMGGVVGVALGGYVIFHVVKRGMTWFKVGTRG